MWELIGFTHDDASVVEGEAGRRRNRSEHGVGHWIAGQYHPSPRRRVLGRASVPYHYYIGGEPLTQDIQVTDVVVLTAVAIVLIAVGVNRTFQTGPALAPRRDIGPARRRFRLPSCCWTPVRTSISYVPCVASVTPLARAEQACRYPSEFPSLAWCSGFSLIRTLPLRKDPRDIPADRMRGRPSWMDGAIIKIDFTCEG
ncbi:hypothetical protein ACFHW2_38310 [Actinomadura sp. LOL_016]|uniref:hypothetical protein n=1 Tax=unclassified Actinomadura TaxID=2626254 RepID=UPI003A8069A1